jgi:hypothetical protein
MAKTSDPHAATVKAWQTRARNAGSGGAVQQRKDWKKTWTDRDEGLMQTWISGVGSYEKLRRPGNEDGRRMTLALKKLPVHSGASYRGLRHALRHPEMLTEGAVFVTKKHSSCSKDKEYAKKFSGVEPDSVLIKIEGRTRDLTKTGVGHRRGESETVLMAGTRLRVMSVKRSPGSEIPFFVVLREE